MIRQLTPDQNGWMACVRLKRGPFPANYVEQLSPSTRLAKLKQDFESGAFKVREHDVVIVSAVAGDSVKASYANVNASIPLQHVSLL